MKSMAGEHKNVHKFSSFGHCYIHNILQNLRAFICGDDNENSELSWCSPSTISTGIIYKSPIFYIIKPISLNFD